MILFCGVLLPSSPISKHPLLLYCTWHEFIPIQSIGHGHSGVRNKLDDASPFRVLTFAFLVSLLFTAVKGDVRNRQQHRSPTFPPRVVSECGSNGFTQKFIRPETNLVFQSQLL